ncbi:cytosolic phospholipase A2 gamma [Bufo gargarizans]|uniref:cytosolic phospholipase A2 gamma n=1 Tax=Bufo gargarizans TaxID=30331 RepID=UPI001CF3DCA4|nr:cytosolic phospholipase A2 gamma [Bufo gargarizans]XP_044130999.1 cytosolic phospholipase A2 gamma [Bufo gargarizans]XP_044131006.1 cytosolic phospholipase A2 gamma [Bufo gargarizans]XP_044131013.1 cytosolic phospholipase A2 gamma [Bufo gargarizans]XP_044131018.1 cytosolic phospholipase A2 gamma [Bufo gargarizans]XP_044131024.1 cytosolic phospholipase A2 gamma [Bufo gargarizans]
MEKQIDIVCHECDPSNATQVPEALLRSEGELTSIKARQKKVREALKKFNVIIPEDKEPPVIAVLGSGGGLRAMVGFLGVLGELAREGLLDVITYICGISGSTWAMSSLYNNEKWSSCMVEMEHQIIERLLNPSMNLEKMWGKLKQSFSEEMFSLTDFWAYVFVHKVISDINEKTLSNHRTSCEIGENPYPVYAAVEKDSLNKFQPGAWFEFTPHLVGFPAYNSFVRTELLGSQFSEGKLVKNYPEWDICYLQGMWGSAPANNNAIKNFIKDRIHKLFPNITNEGSCSEASQLSNIEGSQDSEEPCLCNGCQKVVSLLSNHDLLEMTHAKMEMVFEDSDKNVEGFCEKVNLVQNVLQCFVHWKWGTTNNFLYKWSSNIPDDLHCKEYLSLIDAGLEINSAYPLMLPPNRKIDLILSFDFSEGDPFLTLKSTDEYCKINGIPFVKFNIEDSECEEPSQSCYVFEEDGKEAPDVMHFPLFNEQSCEGKILELRKKYVTANMFYDESELTEVLKIAKQNVELNKDRILEKILQVQQCKSSV